MTSSLYISSTASGSGKILIALGIIESLLRKTTKIGFFRPISPDDFGEGKDADIDFILAHFALDQTYEEAFAWRYREVSELMGQQQWDRILDRIIRQYKALEEKFEFILCEGSDYLSESSAFEFNLNREIVKNLGCPSLILGNAFHNCVEDAITPINIAFDAYRERSCSVAGIIINKVEGDRVSELKAALEKQYGDQDCLLAVIPYHNQLASPRIEDIVEQLNANVLYGHPRLHSLVSGYVIAAMQMQHALSWFQEDSLVVTPGDRGDIIIGALQANQSSNYPHVAGLLLSTGFTPEPAIARLLEGLPDPLPILSVESDTFTTAARLKAVTSRLKSTDHEKINLIIQIFNENVETEVLARQIAHIRTQGITPKMFTYNLIQQAKAKKRHIVLPEGTEPRILKAAAVLLQQEIVEITLLGKPEDIEQALKRHGIQLAIADLTIIDPLSSDQLEAYSQALFALRQHKGMTLDAAHDTMLDSSYFGTMMVYQGDADGMVSGAIHTTQHTIRPALQIIKTTAGVAIVSSVFFMCLEDGVVVYGDCAVNPSPTADQLAEIAITSADTAQRFGIIPKVALLSYSSGESGQGVEVEKVRAAAQIARAKRPDLKLEGPIQYDAAVDPSVAAQKMPDSAVAGQASVFIFPDLNTGNNTYKAVQRETGAIAIGPILQGLRKPVNDLSRGCSVEDIINTIVITAIQAQ
jgi:phosphate acetyltransferase